ncbi:hypothetical protein HHK36_015544 [Tetracentron sinense]|uniref:Uncharacterized protein n=1 Tax=Tetracentron sinense TaxID=13715 RepID=A0A835DDR3_TETSI|nr:hypothetical protein HHK36_015544 [Tetracentron sinense]
MANPSGGGLEALHRLKSVEPPLWLSPSSELSQAARTASELLFSSLHPFCPKSPFDRLLVEGFDAEQIWQQIDLQTQPLISNLRRDLKRFERNPEEISKLFGGEITVKVAEERAEGFEKEGVGFEEINGGEQGFEDLEDMDDEDMEAFDEEEEEEDEEGEEGEDEEDGDGGGGEGIEDRFLKIKELEEYMVEDEAREYGDFFGSKRKKSSERRSNPLDELEDPGTDDEQEDNKGFDNQKKEAHSTHEKHLEKLRSEIEEMEKANLEPKTWTMQGEVTAAKRPKNSALEVDLDFEHNVRPAPVVTEEVTASLEDLIKKRILEEHFDDVQKAPSLPSKSPKELRELDENKSKKGLAEIYEEEYVQKTDLASAPLSFSDEQKKEASLLFKKLCLKLDALSHFHFTPKPIIEDMSIKANVPALAMEEIAPVAVSYASMLAPEEVFAGKGDIKEEAELTQAERKRRRANKKRKFKAKTGKKMAKKARENTILNHTDGKEVS